MSLFRFPALMDRTVDDLISLADLLRAIRDSSGDLTFDMVDRVHGQIRTLRIGTKAALLEAEKNTSAAGSVLQSVGGPDTLAEFQSQLGAIGSSIDAWSTALGVALAALTSAELVSVQTVSRDGVDSERVAFAGFIPARSANPLRQSQALADAISALEAAGA